MLSPELKKLKDSLEGKIVSIDKNKLLKELCELDIESLNESLALSKGTCPTCGSKIK